YDHPNAFDTELMISHIKCLKNGESIDRPSYSFVEHTRTNETVHIMPAKVIIVEGILIFENKDLLNLMDIKIFVDTDADVRLIRRLLRDVKERGRDLDSVIKQYLTTVKPMHEEFVEPSKKNADVIIPEGGFNSVALSMIIDKIKTFLSQK
ncbi:MAG: uridine kinase, partial [Epulopiscium sp.]|nr:uridine kinase [Candidatus Epulonipiscium sp.]